MHARSGHEKCHNGSQQLSLYSKLKPASLVEQSLIVGMTPLMLVSSNYPSIDSRVTHWLMTSIR